MDNLNEKIEFFINVIENIQTAVNMYNSKNIISINDYNFCLENIEKISNLIKTFDKTDTQNIVSNLQFINNSLSSIIKSNGIYNFNNLINICLNNCYNKKYLDNNHKFYLINKYCHPICYKILNWNNKIARNIKKDVQKNKIIDDKTYIECNNLECFDLCRTYNNFYIRVNGIKILLHDYDNKRTLLVDCIIDNFLTINIDNNFYLNKQNEINSFIDNVKNSEDNNFKLRSWNNYYKNLQIKDYLIYSIQELYNKYLFTVNSIYSIEKKTLDKIVEEFVGSDLYSQRTLLITLLLNDYKEEYQYISYLLYDLLSDDNNNLNDSNTQKLLYNSLPFNCKNQFKYAMHKTIEYTTTLLNYDNSKIPLEQQICLMKVENNVKEKAMQKLKELKSKSEDSGSKARQYLDGLLKIPFGIYVEEQILLKKKDIQLVFNNFYKDIKNLDFNKEKSNNFVIAEFLDFLKEMTTKKTYNLIEIINYTNCIKNYKNVIDDFNIQFALDFLNNKSNKKQLQEIIKIYNKLCNNKILLGDTKCNILSQIMKNTKICLDCDIQNKIIFYNNNDLFKCFINMEKHINYIDNTNKEIINYINSFNKILNKSVYGHVNAKKQIERILGQWINGENSGYCFGFEGPPGIGKTSLAKKGIANCLLDKNNNPRPFSLIALGGSSNGSTLEGHNYTYVGSTWGKIVDILIEHKCMNPIIFIDELDKVSKTEHGRELIGILTHLIDPAQNNGFQDKYFSNIDLDLSKVLFIFSYNDVELIDKILLDRIHRIKFDNLLSSDKLIIAQDYLIPELYKKFDIHNIINFSDEIIKYIIENYTNESGVRKLKEILFEIISSINLDLLKKKTEYNIPIIVTEKLISDILYDRNFIRFIKINNISKVGVINGLWANSYGNSGILHIESKLFHSNNFMELKLTGMQGDVMKESMSVAKTLSISLLTNSEMKKIDKEMEETKLKGIHIHVPEGATPKDGPSAGAAICVVIYSLLTKKKIKNDIAITGEICLQGNVTAIGGLDLKIIGAIRAGVKKILYPKDNSKDFKEFSNKYSNLIDNIEFFEVSNINDVLKYMLI